MASRSGSRDHDVFISYSHDDREIVHWLAAQLEDADVSVWLDAIELSIGDSLHRSIEQGIEDSRYFCFVISEASLKSYYVREVEFEQAFTRMIEQQGRRSYILPITLGVPSSAVPLRIRHLFRLDFSRPEERSKNVAKVVRAIRGIDDRFTGSRLFKGLNITNLGAPAGTGPVTQMASLGQTYQMHWQDGIVTRVDVFTDGALSNYKEFGYDDQGRVIENRMYSPNGSGGWAVIKDVWYYSYDPVTGLRQTKTMRYLGEHTALVDYYDSEGRAIREEVVTDPGFPPDRDYPYAAKEFLLDADGNKTGDERWFDSDGVEIPSRTSKV